MPATDTTEIRTGNWRFDHSYARLPASLYTRINPVPVASPQLCLFNHALAQNLGLDTEMLESDYGTRVFSGNRLPEAALPLAQAYAGHQFGYFNMLGDGRAILLGEHLTPEGKRCDIQLKGSGPTPYSRRGDGRAALGPMLREYLISEAMHRLGIPTTRSLAVVATGEPVIRETVLPGAILTRVASSHIRVGTFEYLVMQRDTDALRALADHALQRHYPECLQAENPYLAMLAAIMERQAALIALWVKTGFIHGVMNTDNMSISGETIDYGPCAFMDHYDPETVFSSIDHDGRYAFGNQAQIAHWNLARLAEVFARIIHSDPKQGFEAAEAMLHTYPERYSRHWLAGMSAKLGLFTPADTDKSLIDDLLSLMQLHRADYTHTFRSLALNTRPESVTLFRDDAFKRWEQRWLERLARQPLSPEDARSAMLQHNPAIIPRNYAVESALSAATEQGNLQPIRQLIRVLQSPYAETHDASELAQPPTKTPGIYRTFCGT